MELIQKQRKFFLTHSTKDLKFRKNSLKKLLAGINRFEEKILDALYADLHKHRLEAYGTEIGIVKEEIHYQLKHLKRFGRPKRYMNDILNFPGTSRIYPQPYGVALIISPWNYPFQLLINPLVGAIAAGNCAVLKPANYSKNVTAVIQEMISDCFDDEYIAVVTGGRDVIQELLEEKYDVIFFTGSPHLGRIVMEKAARHLTPVVLELGGKSPCIVDEDADLEVAARRIMFGKLLNSGQTCIAPDYCFVHSRVKDRFLEKIKGRIKKLYSDDPSTSGSYGRIINDQQFKKLSQLIKSGRVYCGGRMDPQTRYIEPTILVDIKPEDPIMNEEIFGPIFPVMEFNRIDEVIDFVNRRDHPLAFYYFSGSRKKQRDIIHRTSAGGGCINDTMMHLTNPKLPFGGVGLSGMGRYHGKYSFDAFTHYRTMLSKSTLVDIPFRYAPYRDSWLKFLKLIMR